MMLLMRCREIGQLVVSAPGNPRVGSDGEVLLLEEEVIVVEELLDAQKVPILIVPSYYLVGHYDVLCNMHTNRKSWRKIKCCIDIN